MKAAFITALHRASTSPRQRSPPPPSPSPDRCPRFPRAAWPLPPHARRTAAAEVLLASPVERHPNSRSTATPSALQWEEQRPRRTEFPWPWQAGERRARRWAPATTRGPRRQWRRRSPRQPSPGPALTVALPRRQVGPRRRPRGRGVAARRSRDRRRNTPPVRRPGRPSPTHGPSRCTAGERCVRLSPSVVRGKRLQGERSPPPPRRFSSPATAEILRPFPFTIRARESTQKPNFR